VIFAADDGTNGREWWVSDGTAGGTTLLNNVNAGTANGAVSYRDRMGAGVVDGVFYFVGESADHGKEVWKSDGTASGTVRVTDVVTGSSNGVNDFSPFIKTQAGIVFVGVSSTTPSNKSYYLLGSNSSVTEFTQGELKNFSPTGTGFSFAGGTKALLVGTDTTNPNEREIWVTDGTTSTFVTNGQMNEFYGAVEIDGGVIFDVEVYNGSSSTEELWFYSTSTNSAAMIKDFDTASNRDDIELLGVVNGKALLLADDGSTGIEYWVSDGTSAGTVSLGDLNPGTNGQGSVVNRDAAVVFTSDGTRAYFEAIDGTTQGSFGFASVLMTTDGSVAGTTRVSNEIADLRAVTTFGDTLMAAGFYKTYPSETWGSGEGVVIGLPGTDSSLDSLSVMPSFLEPPSGPVNFPMTPSPRLDPAFDNSVTEYAFDIAGEWAIYDAVSVDARTLGGPPGAPVSCEVEGESCTDFGVTVPIDGPRFVRVVVTAADGSSTTYTIAVSVNGVVPTTTTTTTTTEAPATTAAPSTTAAPVTTVASGPQAPSLVTSANQEQLSSSAGTAKILVNGELVEVELVQAPEELRRTAAGARTFAQVRALQALAVDMVATVQAVLGEGVTLPITVTNTSTGATITGLVSDPVTGEALAVPVEDVLLIVNQSIALMVGGADGANNPANIAFDGVLEFGEGGYVAVLAYGLTPGAAGEVVVMSTPRLLDTFAVGADGGVAVQAQIPTDLEAGDHTVVVAIDGQSASLGFRVLSPGILPSTGSESPVSYAVLVLALGAFAALMVTRRRNTI
jgi:LPXTG-motif cell wall-anchored protein